MKNLSQHPIFIIGTSRSGTELMSQILSKHSNVKIVMETHYFEDLRQQVADGKKPLNLEETKLCQDYFLALTHKIYGEGGEPEKGWMKRDELKNLADTIGGNSDAYFEAFCRIYAARDNKIIWGEKTPRHVFRISEIISCYPNAKIIYMLRHPAGVVASYRNFWKLDKHSDAQRNRLKNSYHPIVATMLWKSGFKAALYARQQFGEKQIYIQKFEDLIDNPESSVKTLVNWLSLDYESAMIENIALINSLDNNTQNTTGFVKTAANRWQKELSAGDIAAIESCCGISLKEAGYQSKSISFIDWLMVIKLWLNLPLNLVKIILANRDRMGNIFSYLWKRLRLLIFNYNKAF